MRNDYPISHPHSPEFEQLLLAGKQLEKK